MTTLEAYRFADSHRKRAENMNLDVMVIAGKPALIGHWLDEKTRKLSYGEQQSRARLFACCASLPTVPASLSIS